ncbi:MAG: TnpV protein [Clostridia bacterium]|jgi:transcriptional regulator NrdR family protein
MKIEYTKVGDYYLQNLVAPSNMKNFEIGKYGKLRLKYLKEHKKAEYTILLMDNKLQKHLMEIDKIANERFDLLMKQFAQKENITEELKAKDQLKWVGLMNNIKHSAEEIILKELIYV